MDITHIARKCVIYTRHLVLLKQWDASDDGLGM